MPFIQNVIKYDRRNIGLDIPNIEVLASNQEQLIVDAFVRYLGLEVEDRGGVEVFLGEIGMTAAELDTAVERHIKSVKVR